MTAGRVEFFSANRRDELKGELGQYDPEMTLFDGRAATEGLRMVINAPYVLEETPTVVFNGSALAEAREAAETQPTLF